MKSSEIVQCICEALVNDGNLRVKGPQTGYRCKATYSLYAGLETSILVMDAVNDVCRTVDDFRRTHSAFAVRFPKFFFEVSAKISRRCEYLVKLVILNAPALSGEVASETAPKTIFEEWMQSSEPTELVAFLRNRFPSVTTVVAHVRLEFCSEDVRCPLSGKPDKSCAYIPLTNEKVLMEYTPNGFVYQLSADSFSEVNQPMEDAIFHSIVEFLHLEKPSVEGGAQLTRRAFISGRDVNSVVKTFEPFYQDTFAATTCPCVFADALDNHIPSCKLVAKDALHEELRRYLGDGTSHFDVLLTAGRHGLHPSTATELVHLANMGCLEHLIYVSCNVVSFARDQYTLKEGFRIHHLRTFDFFPGTPYVMTVVHFRPLSLERSGGPLLILPVGPPGAGKSSCGRLLMSHFENERQCEGLTCISLKKETKKRPSCAVPRSINSSVVSNVTFMHVERDALFASCKSKHMSLRASRGATHEALIASLHSCESSEAGTVNGSVSGLPRRRVVFLDSTNGSFEARQLYQDTWNLSAPFHSKHAENGEQKDMLPVRTLILHFSWERNVLLHRVQQRCGHPSFPVDCHFQEEKIAHICSALDAHPMKIAMDPSTGVLEHIVHNSSKPGATANDTCAEVSTVAYVSLMLSTPLAIAIVDASVALVLKRM